MLAPSAVLLLLAAPLVAQDWPRFRGPNGSGVSSSTAVWTESDRLWKVKLPGKGHSSPVVWRKRIFVTSGDVQTAERTLVCLDAIDGRTHWTRSFPAAKHRHHEDNSGASGTPTVDERHVYVPWASPKDYLVVALDHAGNEKWRVDLGPFQSGHGFGVSLIVHDGLVIVPNEQEGKSSVVALDRDAGKTRWQLPRRSKTTYSTPCLWQPQGRLAEVILGNYEHGVTSVDPKTGTVNWEFDVFDKGHMETSIASPFVSGDLIFGCSGWLGVKKEVIAVRPPGEKSKPEIAFKLTRSAPLVPTPLVKDGLLYMWDDEGIVTCADAVTGKVLWQERVEGNYYASPIAAGDRVYNVSRRGELIALAAGKEFRELARFDLGEGSFSTPAIVGDMLYVRTFTHLLAFGPKTKQTSRGN